MAQTNHSLNENSRQIKFIKNKPAKFVAKLLVVLFPMVIAPMVSYDFLIFYFKHNTVIFGSMVFGLMSGIVLLYLGEKVPKLFLGKF